MNGKTKAVAVIAAICAALVLGAAALSAWAGGSDTEKQGYSRDITVKDGVADPAVKTEEVNIAKSGNYRIRLSWKAAQGLLTGAKLTSQKGEVVLYATGECLEMESIPLALDEGTYTLEYVFLTNAADVAKFVQSCIDPAGPIEEAGVMTDGEGRRQDINEYPFAKNGTWTIRFAREVEMSGAENAERFAALATGVAVGLLIILMILLLTVRKGSEFFKYDERQQLARGKGYRAGFWTAFAYLALMVMCGAADISIPVEMPVIAFVGMMLGGFVFASYCIWSDAYFAINENRAVLCICAIIAGLGNLAIGISNALRGALVENGLLTFRAVNPICGVFILAIGLMLLIKKVTAAREDDEG